MKKGILIYNAYSGNKSLSKKLDLIIDRFQENDILLQIYRLERDDTRLTKVLKENKYDFAILAGGDGSVNLGANTLLKNKINIPVGFIPAGTSNDLVRCLNIPNDIEECIDIIIKGKTTKIDVGLLNKEKYFLGTYGGGAFVGVSFDPKINELKKNFGPIAYYLKGMLESINLKSFTFHIDIDGKSIKEEALLFLILNGKHAAGFRNVTDTADMSDGKMELVIMKKCKHVEMTKIFLKLLNKEFISDPHLKIIKAKKCKIKNITKNMAVTIDGEEAESIPSEIEFLNKKLSVFVKD